MKEQRLAHLSDLHLGESPHATEVARRAVEWLLAHGVEHVLITGDVTHRGRDEERALFDELFAPLRQAGRLSVVPGNHDRVGGGAAGDFLDGQRVKVSSHQGLHLVLLDSTGPQNESYFRSDGTLEREQIATARAALAIAPRDALVVVALHHHPLPLPTESFQERLAMRLGWPHADALATGEELVRACIGSTSLLLHGHRHRPWTREILTQDAKLLRVSNAGSMTEQGSFRLYRHAAGEVLGQPRWIPIERRKPANAPLRELWTALAESMRGRRSPGALESPRHERNRALPRAAQEAPVVDALAVLQPQAPPPRVG